MTFILRLISFEDFAKFVIGCEKIKGKPSDYKKSFKSFILWLERLRDCFTLNSEYFSVLKAFFPDYKH